MVLGERANVPQEEMIDLIGGKPRSSIGAMHPKFCVKFSYLLLKCMV